ncbi:hypothetical protein LTR08_000484 [Meristemomyces frigidus]|nr:hypothetical protein LTR08_000484 [Meristemomyces frigidus]
MSGGFSFPPPPPPPPKAAPSWNGGQDAQYGSQQNRGGQSRGRGRGSQDGRGRGRGQHHQARGNHFGNGFQHGAPNSGNGPNGNNPAGTIDYGMQQQLHNPYQQPYRHPSEPRLPPGAFVNPTFAQPPLACNNEYNQGRPFQPALDTGPPYSGSPPRTYAGHKRKLEALRPPAQERLRPGPPAAPAFPSFGASILPPKPVNVLPPEPRRNVRLTNNALGLTPGQADQQYQSSEEEAEDEAVDEDVDEEAAYAELGTKLTFEHNGAILSLSSAADLAAWKDDRRKQWPTRARMTEKEAQRRQIGHERKRLLAGARQLENANTMLKSRTSRGSGVTRRFSQETKEKTGFASSNNALTAAEQKPASKLEEARQELVKQEAKLDSLRKNFAVRETSLQKARALEEEQDFEALKLMIDNTPTPDITSIERKNDADDASDAVSEVLSDSSVLSSNSDDEGPPDESTSKAPATLNDRTQGLLCRYFVASGYCRDGDACRYRHELAPRGTAVRPPQRPPQPARDRDAPRLDPSATAEKKSIFQRLMEQQQEEGDRLVLQVIKHLGAAGFFSVEVGEGE